MHLLRVLIKLTSVLMKCICLLIWKAHKKWALGAKPKALEPIISQHYFIRKAPKLIVYLFGEFELRSGLLNLH